MFLACLRTVDHWRICPTSDLWSPGDGARMLGFSDRLESVLSEGLLSGEIVCKGSFDGLRLVSSSVAGFCSRPCSSRCSNCLLILKGTLES